jgi:hypothetical protein
LSPAITKTKGELSKAIMAVKNSAGFKANVVFGAFSLWAVIYLKAKGDLKTNY